jgi:hypothetical protein
MSKGDGSDSPLKSTAIASEHVPAADCPLAEESALPSRKTVAYGCYLVFFTTLWFLSGEAVLLFSRRAQLISQTPGTRCMPSLDSRAR